MQPDARRKRELWEAIQAEPFWWLSIDLGDGRVARGEKSLDVIKSRCVWEVMPRDIAGKSVIDMGCAEGYFSFWAEQRGASRVVAVDWEPETCRRFRLAHEYLGSQVEFVQSTVEELNAHELGTFDVVLCMGLIYHLRDPVLGLERAASLLAPGGRMVLESHVVCVGASGGVTESAAAARFWLGDPANEGRWNWWSPNVLCVHRMLRFCGLTPVRQVLRGDRGAWLVMRSRDAVGEEVAEPSPRDYIEQLHGDLAAARAEADDLYRRLMRVASLPGVRQYLAIKRWLSSLRRSDADLSGGGRDEEA
jgi:tRNA (mo5U34)-methyltransferase